MIQAIIFDIGGVLLDDPIAEMITYCTNSLQVNREPFVEALNKFWEMWLKGNLSEREVWERLTTDLKITCRTFGSLWLDGFKQAYREKPEVFALLKQLKQQGYTIALLSNTEPPIMRYLKQKQYEHVDLCLYSCEIGLRKPEKAIYAKMLHQLGVRPQEAVFIDDRAENVEGATRMGIPSILFRNSDDLKKQLRRYRISL